MATLEDVLSDKGVRNELRKNHDLITAHLDSSQTDLQTLSRYMWPRYRVLLKDVILTRLDRPLPVHADEVATAFCDQVVMAPDRSFEQAFEAFAVAIKRLIVRRRSEATPVATGRYCLLSPDLEDGEIPRILLWNRPPHLLVCVVGLMPGAEDRDLLDPHQRTLYVSIEAECSPMVFAALPSELLPVVRSVLRSCETIELQRRRTRNRDGFQQAWQYGDEWDEFTFAVGNELGGIFNWIPALLDEYFADSTKKDSIARRIGNATRLIVEADRQERHAVGTALCVAATETLLCQKGGELVGQFSENVAALLEREPRFRPNAVRWAKKLYAFRSEVFHTGRCECSAREWSDARILAAAALKGIMERRAFRKKAGYDDETPQDLLGELADDKYTPGQLTGVEESPIMLCWRESE